MIADVEGAVKKRGNDNDAHHEVFDSEVDPSSLASILPILRFTKQKEEEYGIFVIIATTFVQFYCFFSLFNFILASILLPFLNAVYFIFLLQEIKET
jgi:hypothetical protein